jgi:opine dehydrogenase
MIIYKEQSMNKNIPRFTVVGAGHGGKAMAAHLAFMGFEVTLYNRTYEHIEAIKSRGGISLKNMDTGTDGFGVLKEVTSDMAVALENADVIMVVVPASAHRSLAEKMSDYLKDGQIVVLNPGRTLGALEFMSILKKKKCQADVIIAETQTFIYASRSDGPAQARIFRIKEAVPLAAIPATKTQEVLDVVRQAYPQFIDGETVLHTGMNNIGAVFHPTISLLNAGWIEATSGNFQFYLEGVTPTVARIMEEIDRERVNVAAALGIKALTAREWLKLAYNAEGETLHAAIHAQPGYRGINAPATLEHRYIFEDVPMSLVPIAALGQRFGVPIHGVTSIVNLACLAHKTNYWAQGRTVKKMGVTGLTAEEIFECVTQGKLIFDKDDLFD